MRKIFKQRLSLFIICFCLCGLVFYEANKHTSIKDFTFGHRQPQHHAIEELKFFDIEETKTGEYCEDVYVGCFDLDMKKKTNKTSHSHMSRNQCVLTCSEKQSSYAGLTNGSTCVCFPQVRSIANALKPGKCDAVCPGNNHETCGGADSIDVIQILSPCFKGEPDLFEEERYLGCFTNNDNNNFGKVEFLLPATTSITLCILRCSLKKYPLAATDTTNAKCICGWFTEKLNLLHRVETCEASSLKIYRTLAEDKRCSYPHFLSSNSSVKRSLLTSFPGSGNSWTRYLIEQASQVFTGSEYNDGDLYKSGMLGELTDANSNRTFVIKSHSNNPDIRKKFDIHSIIVILRNPFDAFISDFNRQHSQGHKSLANETIFQSEDFIQFAMHSGWESKLQGVVSSELPFHVLIYENLVHDPISEMRKVMKFLELNNGFKQPNLEQRLLCLAENLQGRNKRTSKKLKPDPYSKKMISKINEDIAHVRQYITSKNISVILPRYERAIN